MQPIHHLPYEQFNEQELLAIAMKNSLQHNYAQPVPVAHPGWAQPMPMQAPVAQHAPPVTANAPPPQQVITMDKMIYVDAPVPPPVVQT